MTAALKAAREVLAQLEHAANGLDRQSYGDVVEVLCNGADALRTALAEVDRLIADNENDKMKALLYRAYNSPEPEARQAAFRDAMQRAALAEAEIDRLAASENRLQWVLPLVTGSNDNAADERTAAMMLAMARGLDGIEAIDFAMKENP